MNQTQTKTVGRDAACDLVLDDPSVSTLHARIALSGDGFLYVEDAGSDSGTWLTRNGRKVRALRATVCAGDELSFGERTVPTEQLTRLFRQERGLRLHPRPFPRASMAMSRGPASPRRDAPRRDPATGVLSATDKESRTE